MRSILCLAGSHFWVEEASDHVHGVLLRATCCQVTRLLKEAESDWELIGTYPAPHPASLQAAGEDGFLEIGEQKTYRCKSNWWREHMRGQRWAACQFYGCAMPIRCAASERFCLFHHEWIDVKHQFSERELQKGRVRA
jgi:hypothetical protein